jgi:uncharacterized protein (DUF1810 family)
LEAPAVSQADLIRFVNAQADVYSQVIEELTEGYKRTHWMWFIFPRHCFANAAPGRIELVKLRVGPR